MAKIVYVRDDGTQNVIRENLDNDLKFIAVRFFTKEDLCRALSEKGFSGTAETADKVLEFCPELKTQLEEEKERDAVLIGYAIEVAHVKGLISYERELDKLLEKNGCEYISCSYCDHFNDGCFYSHYWEKADPETAKMCGRFEATCVKRLILSYADEEVELPILHTNEKVDINPAEILYIAEHLLPEVKDDVQNLIAWRNEDREDGIDEQIEVIEA